MVADIEAAMVRHGLTQERIALRITARPEGCVRPYAGISASWVASPGNTRYSLGVISPGRSGPSSFCLEPLFASFAADRMGDDGCGDFCTPMGLLAMLPSQAAAAE